MTNTNETVADIIAEMRFHGQQNVAAEKDKPEYGILTVEGRITKSYADRLDAAHKREVAFHAMTCEANERLREHLQIALDTDKRERGDCAKLREALENAAKELTDATEDENFGDDVLYLVGCMRTVSRKCRAALDAAHRRECGDCAKLREAMIEVLEYIETFHKYITPGKGKKLTALFAVADTIRDKARAALAAPPRNCDKYATADKAIAFFADEALLEEWEALKLGKDRDMLATELFSFIKWLFAPATEKEGDAK